jgi:hypothetical protein
VSVTSVSLVSLGKTSVTISARGNTTVVIPPTIGHELRVGIIGGAPGPVGPGGSGFGGLQYTDLDTGTPLILLTDQWAVVNRNLVPSAANYNLPLAPFANFAFWSGGLLHARALGDYYLYKFAYRITPTLRGATIRFAVRPAGDPAFDFGPAAIPITSDAGVADSGTVTFITQARTRFVASGAQILVKLSCGGAIDFFNLEVIPLAFHP